MIFAKNIIESLLIVSEKAARLAKICRQNGHLLSLLIEEKENEEKNARFVKDFKTLTDVLVQELIKYDLLREYPELKDSIYGEENNKFTNALGESIIVTLDESKLNTTILLKKVLNGDEEAAHSLSETIHSRVSILDVPVNVLPDDSLNFDLQNLALWIDPIDSTAEYINGDYTFSNGVSLSGLNCVTILIGIFDKRTGVPIIGVVSQPFFIFEDDNWTGRTFWGISFNEFRKTSTFTEISPIRDTALLAISSNENEIHKRKLESAGFELISPAGAGYKVLCVILGIVDAYVLSQGTTYFWDTCGSHAVLKGMNGNIWNFEKAVCGELSEISYHEKKESIHIKEYSNKFGIIACKDEATLRRIIAALQ